MGTNMLSSKCSSFSYFSARRIALSIDVPKIKVTKISTARLPNRSLVAELDYLHKYIPTTTTTHTKEDPYYSKINTDGSTTSGTSTPNSMEEVKLRLIMEVVADRIEMHKNIGAQRDNWNRLLMTSVNMITLSASAMVGLAAASPSGAPIVALKVSSTILYMAATGLILVMNKIQPSQLAEEQRNAARLFKQLHGELRTRLSLGNPSENDVEEAMEKVLALDGAYPLPLLGSMLEKLPRTVEPAVWWPRQKQRSRRKEELGGKLKGKNGWDARSEGEMRKIGMILRKKDMAEYLRLGKQVLNFNKVLAVSGPLLSGLAALGSCFLGSVSSSWPVMVGVIGGALASVVNTLEHGGQVGMVFEMYRANCGFFKLMEESIELNITEEDPHKRENGELFEIKVALQLGRSLSELRQFAAAVSSSHEERDFEEFASKLF
ncbi:probable F-box protein At4g22030 [Vigna radiata var. radiata]|uniref:Probable F-box protein At4g22030 n=1 Tax=Vigna radiata var. radiata TaxID=3916 RepID=A0A1S3VIN7_VIGRR|nr:probable F-box protein At4g22030 [Vigna radiata var. radiata]